MEEAHEYIKLPSSPPEEIYCHDNNQNLQENTYQNRDGDAQADGGATFVLASKGTWWHAGFHLTTAIVGPSILTLPYAFRCMGWTLGVISLSLAAAVSFYAYFLMSQVLDHCEKNGRRHIRFRELASDVLGYGWMFYLVVSIQTTINTGICVGCILLGAECLEVMYADIDPDGNLNLHHFILMVAAVMMVMSQLPSFHSLRHINFVSLFLSLGYSFCIAVACILAGNSSKESKDYSLPGSKASRVFNTFQAMSLMATTYGNGILPEIQATLAPPATGKMLKGLCMCYGVMVVTFYSVAVSGYWAFGSNSKDNILENLMSDDNGVALVPLWLVVISVIFIILQIFAIALVYSQVAYEILEKKSADVRMGVFSLRNLIPRLILRSVYVIFCAFIAAMLPFFGDINALVGAVGFVPLDFILPMLLYNMSFKPPRVSAIRWVNSFIMVIFTGVGIVGAISAVRQIVIDAKRFKLFSTTVID